MLFKTEPYPHQLAALGKSADAEYYALLMSMRTGKSKVIIDTTAHLYGKGRIDALVVVAPNNVHRNWIEQEVPAHMPDEVPRIAAWWGSTQRKAEREAWEHLWAGDSLPLRVVAFTYDSIITPKGKAELKRVLTAFRCMLAVDESHRAKTPAAQRTKVLLAAAKYAPYRRILTGTAYANSPLDLYAQFKFLHPDILGHSTFTSFRARYAEDAHGLRGTGVGKLMRELKRRGEPFDRSRVNEYLSDDVLVKRAGLIRGRDYYTGIGGFQNLDELYANIAPHAHVVRAADVVGMPEKILRKHPVELTREQRHHYQTMLDEGVAELSAEVAPPPDMSPEDTLVWFLTAEETRVVAHHAMTRALRLQQIVSGYLPDPQDPDVVHPLPTNRPRELMDLLEDIDGKVIIWARFHAELDTIANALRERYGADSVVQYDGRCSAEGKNTAMQRFQYTTLEDGGARFLVGQPQSGGIGLPMHEAAVMVYYSNDYNMVTRDQSIERATRVGKTAPVLVVDMVAPGTTDEKVLDALQRKSREADEFYAAINQSHNEAVL